MSAWSDSRPHFVYWIIDAEGRVLYIGCTRDLHQRLTAHRRRQAWFPRAARIEVQTYETRAPAIVAETEAIYRERPPFNKRVINPTLLPPIVHRGEPLRAVETSAS